MLTVSANRFDGARGRCNLRFSISDNGCGVAIADHERVFEPFVRVGSRTIGQV
nr:ATP-binding protein [Burkholderia glumae]